MSKYKFHNPYSLYYTVSCGGTIFYLAYYHDYTKNRRSSILPSPESITPSPSSPSAYYIVPCPNSIRTFYLLLLRSPSKRSLYIIRHFGVVYMYVSDSSSTFCPIRMYVIVCSTVKAFYMAGQGTSTVRVVVVHRPAHHLTKRPSVAHFLVTSFMLLYWHVQYFDCSSLGISIL